MNQYRQYLQHLSAHSPTTAFLCKSLLGLKLLDEFYLGLDLTNEALTCTIINDHYTPVYRKVVVFDKDLPAKYTERYSDTPAITWIAALDKLFTDITESFEFDLGRVSAIGGSTDSCLALWENGAEAVLGNLDPSASLLKQLEGALLPLSSERVAQAAPIDCHDKQIKHILAKRLSEVPETTIEKTERICFSGSILSGILIGKYADTEISEASIARLWNIQDQAWDENNFDKMSNITSKLGTTCDSSKSLGSVSSYCAKRWRMSKKCIVFPFLNNSSTDLVNMNLGKGDCVLKLDSQDAISLYLPLSLGLQLVDEVNFDSRYPELVFGGSTLATGTSLRHRTCDGDWIKFGNSLRETQPGCVSDVDGAPRISRFSFIPHKRQSLNQEDSKLTTSDSMSPNVWRYEGGHKVAAFHPSLNELPGDNELEWNISHFSREQLVAYKIAQYDARSLIDGMLLSLRTQLNTMTCGKSGAIRRILVTGNDPLRRSGSFLQLISNALQLPVYTLRRIIDTGNSEADTRCMVTALLSRFNMICKDALKELETPGPLEASLEDDMRREPQWIDAVQKERAGRRNRATTTFSKMIKRDGRVQHDHLLVAEPQASEVYKYDELYEQFRRYQKDMLKAE